MEKRINWKITTNKEEKENLRLYKVYNGPRCRIDTESVVCGGDVSRDGLIKVLQLKPRTFCGGPVGREKTCFEYMLEMVSIKY